MRLRSHLITLMIGTLLPMVVFAMVGAYWLTERERAIVERGATERARAVLTALDSELRGSITTLEALAALRQVGSGNLKAVHGELVRALASQSHWLGLSLADPSGQQLVNARYPYGTELPAVRELASLERAVHSRRPAVGSLLAASDGQQNQFSIRVPVIVDATVKYVLSAAVKPQIITALIKLQRVPPSWVAVVLDGNGIFVARTFNYSESVGKMASESLRRAVSASWEGWFHGTTVEGADVYTSFSTSELSQWTVALAIPAAEVEAARRGTIYLLLAGTLIAGLIAVAVAHWLGRRFSAPIVELAAAAKSLGRNPWSAVPLSSQVDEVRELGIALQRSAADLQGADEENRRSIDQLRAADHAKDEFLAMLGHELRNPLAAISGASSVLGTPDIRKDMAERARAILRRQLENLTRLVDDLLDVSRTATGKVALVRRPVELSGIVGAALTAFRSSGRLQAHDISTRFTPVWVDADEVRMEQVASNLIGNAIKFTPPGGRIAIEVEPLGESAVLRVSDTGSGIVENLIDKVFDSFVQGSNAIDRAQGGLGLGLALVKALVQLHGGSVEVKSAGPGQGSVFTVRLPSIRPAARDAAAKQGEDQRQRSLRRILIVEDNEDGREALRTLLVLAGHEVHEAADGLSGIEAVAKLAPDLALIDIGLPGIDGYEVARRIRTTEKGRAMRLIAISGYGQPGDRRRAMEAGFDAHLTKPVAIQRLNEFLVT